MEPSNNWKWKKYSLPQTNWRMNKSAYQISGATVYEWEKQYTIVGCNQALTDRHEALKQILQKTIWQIIESTEGIHTTVTEVLLSSIDRRQNQNSTSTNRAKFHTNFSPKRLTFKIFYGIVPTWSSVFDMLTKFISDVKVVINHWVMSPMH